MKSAKLQQRRKAHYLGTSVLPVYSGSRTQPGEPGQPAGSKLSRRVYKLHTQQHQVRGGGL